MQELQTEYQMIMTMRIKSCQRIYISHVCETGHRFLFMMFKIPDVCLIIFIIHSFAGRQHSLCSSPFSTKIQQNDCSFNWCNNVNLDISVGKFSQNGIGQSIVQHKWPFALNYIFYEKYSKMLMTWVWSLTTYELLDLKTETLSEAFGQSMLDF